jgi:hypothetical protein
MIVGSRKCIATIRSALLRRLLQNSAIHGIAQPALHQLAVRHFYSESGLNPRDAARETKVKTEAIYRRYAIVDEVMLREGAAKLAAYSEGKVLGKVKAATEAAAF